MGNCQTIYERHSLHLRKRKGPPVRTQGRGHYSGRTQIPSLRSGKSRNLGALRAGYVLLQRHTRGIELWRHIDRPGSRNWLNYRCYEVESSTHYTIFEIFCSDRTEKPEKLTKKTASVHIRFMEKGFYAAYTPALLTLLLSRWGVILCVRNIDNARR